MENDDPESPLAQNNQIGGSSLQQPQRIKLISREGEEIEQVF